MAMMRRMLIRCGDGCGADVVCYDADCDADVDDADDADGVVDGHVDAAGAVIDDDDCDDGDGDGGDVAGGETKLYGDADAHADAAALDDAGDDWLLWW
eukprot:4013834-Pyramimonas_sp.AAC.1